MLIHVDPFRRPFARCKAFCVSRSAERLVHAQLNWRQLSDPINVIEARIRYSRYAGYPANQPSEHPASRFRTAWTR